LDKREEDLDVATTVACFNLLHKWKEGSNVLRMLCLFFGKFFFCVYLLLEKLVNEKYFSINEKHFPIKEKISLISRKVFSFYFRWKTLFGRCEIEMSYYLLIISNLVLKLLIAIYILF
jgi:hypothetical protein